MAKYEKWLGASLGWIVTGNPLGAVLGFIAGTVINGDETDTKQHTIKGVSEFEVNLMVMAAYLIKTDGGTTQEEISFTENFLNTHFDERYAAERTRILHHCLQKEYDLNAACGQVRMYSAHGTKVQVIRFLIDLAQCDGPLHEKEEYFIFRVAGYLNVNDAEFRRIKMEHVVEVSSTYQVLGVTKDMSFAEIRSSYRKLVLKYHPDRNKDASDEDKKKLARKFQQIQEAYEKIKAEMGG